MASIERTSATVIYDFAERRARRMSNLKQVSRTVLGSQKAAVLSGDAWYHEAAIAAERDGPDLTPAAAT